MNKRKAINAVKENDEHFTDLISSQASIKQKQKKHMNIPSMVSLEDGNPLLRDRKGEREEKKKKKMEKYVAS